MRVLVVEGAPGLGADAEAALLAAGHELVGCDPVDRSAPCRGLETIGECPLDTGHVDVAVVSRDSGELTNAERGALCAARRRVPVVISGNPRVAVSFGPGTHLAGSDLVAACEHAASSGVAHAAAVRRELLMIGLLRPADFEGTAPAVSFEVRRDPKRLRLVVRMPAGDPRRASVTKAAAEALRRFDQWATVIDVVEADS